MYLHCHKCGWSQDDFWVKDSYNPLRHMLDWEERLIDKFNEPFPGEQDTKGMTYREVIAREMKNGAEQILHMKWATYEDYKKAKEEGIAKCPKCGSSKDFDID